MEPRGGASAGTGAASSSDGSSRGAGESCMTCCHRGNAGSGAAKGWWSATKLSLSATKWSSSESEKSAARVLSSSTTLSAVAADCVVRA